MFERAKRGTRAILLHPLFADTGPEQLDEFEELCRSAGVEIAAVLTAPRGRPDARFFVGSGKIDEVAETQKEWFRQVLSIYVTVLISLVICKKH